MNPSLKGKVRNRHSMPLASYISGGQGSTNIYEFVDRIHSILYSGEARGGLDAVKGALPIIAYILKKGAGNEDTMAETVELLLRDLRTARNAIIAFIITTKSRLYRNPELDRFLASIEDTVRGIQLTTLRRFLETLRNKEVIRSLLKGDILGALFEKMVYNEFKGGGGKYLTHRNIVIVMREIACALFEKAGGETHESTIYDPCAGSSRYLTFWMDKVRRKNGLTSVSITEYAKQHLFGTDKFSEMVGISALNMIIHGNGVSNIFRADATDHLGFLSDFGAVIDFAKNFRDSWSQVRQKLLGTTFTTEVQQIVIPREDKIYSFADAILKKIDERKIEVNLNSEEIEALYQVIYTLAKMDIALKQLPGLAKLAEKASYPAIHFLVKYVWAKQNEQLKKGFDLIMTNPPMGRLGKGKGGKGQLQITNKHILAQYSVATKIWIPKAPKKILQELCKKKGISLKGYPRGKLIDLLGTEWIDIKDLSWHTYEIVFKDDELSWKYPLFYGSDWEPLVTKQALPIQVLMLEQFLRVARRNGGLVFSVIDVGLLNNPGDEYIRQLLFRQLSKIKAIIELPHGAFRYCGSGSKTSLILYERVEEAPEDYSFFVADVKNMGYDVRSKEATPKAENDLPRAICEWKRSLGLALPPEHGSCGWEKRRTCAWWVKEFEMV